MTLSDVFNQLTGEQKAEIAQQLYKYFHKSLGERWIGDFNGWFPTILNYKIKIIKANKLEKLHE